jgi:hypothetical protein
MKDKVKLSWSQKKLMVFWVPAPSPLNVDVFILQVFNLPVNGQSQFSEANFFFNTKNSIIFLLHTFNDHTILQIHIS